MRKNVRHVTLHVILAAIMVPMILSAQSADSTSAGKISTIPFALYKMNEALKWELQGDSVVSITADKNTNLFNSPGGNWNRQNAPMLLFTPDSNFTLKAKVSADLKEVFDVAALVIYQDNDVWAKLCFENSAEKEATVVSVVTRKYSDDCNSAKLNNTFVYLAIVKKGCEFSFHYSSDNVKWGLVRHFRLDTADNHLMIGFAVHCYSAKTFSADFSEIQYSGSALATMRNIK